MPSIGFSHASTHLSVGKSDIEHSITWCDCSTLAQKLFLEQANVSNQHLFAHHGDDLARFARDDSTTAGASQKLLAIAITHLKNTQNGLMCMPCACFSALLTQTAQNQNI